MKNSIRLLLLLLQSQGIKDQKVEFVKEKKL